MDVHRIARVLLPLAWDISSLLSYGRTSYGTSIIWREYYCPWPGLAHLCYRVAVRCMVRVLLPLAWVISSLLPYGHTPYGVSIIAFGLVYLIFVIGWMYAVWREYYCLWPGLSHFCYRMAVHRMARVLYGASIIALGQG